jgi:hypothetical protein
VSEGHGQDLADNGLWRDDMLWLMAAMFADYFDQAFSHLRPDR